MYKCQKFDKWHNKSWGVLNSQGEMYMQFAHDAHDALQQVWASLIQTP